MISIEPNSAVSNEEWQSYVKNHPEGLIFHLPQWREVLEESFKHRPFYLFAKDEGGRLCGILPLFQIKSWITGNRLVSLPFSLCGPIADSEHILRELVGTAKELCDDLKCSYLELRMGSDQDLGLNTNGGFFTYILELSEPEVVWKKFDPKSVRWAVSKAKKDGVTVRLGSTLEDLKCFYQLNQETKRRLGVPAHPFVFFNNIYSKLGTFVKLYLAELDGMPIAGIINLHYKDTVHYAYAASDERYLKYHPNNLLVWQAIIDSYSEGYHYFDFGKTSPDNEGLTRFKKHWGTEQKKLYYGYYPKIPNLISANRSGARYRFVTSVWKRLPPFLCHSLDYMAFIRLD